MSRRARPRTITTCSEPGCPNDSMSSAHSYCGEHLRRDRSPSSAITGTARWRRVRARVLARDNHICQHCGGPATVVDHVIPISRGGDAFDEANAVASCVSCNSSKGAGTAPRGGHRVAPLAGMPPPRSLASRTYPHAAGLPARKGKNA